MHPLKWYLSVVFALKGLYKSRCLWLEIEGGGMYNW